MEDKIIVLEKELATIKDRNIRVEADKAWEVSMFRKISIAIITYILASLVLYFIGVADFYLSALIPTIGYVLSTLSLPFVKKWWVGKHCSKE